MRIPRSTREALMLFHTEIIIMQRDSFAVNDFSQLAIEFTRAGQNEYIMPACIRSADIAAVQTHCFPNGAGIQPKGEKHITVMITAG